MLIEIFQVFSFLCQITSLFVKSVQFGQMLCFLELHQVTQNCFSTSTASMVQFGIDGWTNIFQIFSSLANWQKESWRAEVGELVWILDKNVHPFNNPFGRIEVIYNTDDTVIRSTLVKTGSYNYPIAELIALISDSKRCFFGFVNKNWAGHVEAKYWYCFISKQFFFG